MSKGDSRRTMLIDYLLDYGLVQFGRFSDTNGDTMPVSVNLGMLPSYPDALAAAHQMLSATIESINTPFDRVLSWAEATPIAVLYAAEARIPMVYSRQCGEPIVHDLVGAYDIAHPTLLILLDDLKDGVAEFVAKAGRVGLKVQVTVTLVGMRQGRHVILTLMDITQRAQQRGDISDKQARLVMQWINHHQT